MTKITRLPAEIKNHIAALLLAVTVCSLAPASAQTPVFVKIDGVTGSSTAAGHVGEIEATELLFGSFCQVSTAEEIAGTRGVSAAKMQLRQLEFNKRVDAASPVLLDMAGRASVVPKARISFTSDQAAGSTVILDLENVLVTETQINAADGGGSIERVVLTFDVFQYTFKPLSGPASTVRYDVRRDKELAVTASSGAPK